MQRSHLIEGAAVENEAEKMSIRAGRCKRGAKHTDCWIYADPFKHRIDVIFCHDRKKETTIKALRIRNDMIIWAAYGIQM